MNNSKVYQTKILNDNGYNSIEELTDDFNKLRHVYDLVKYQEGYLMEKVEIIYRLHAISKLVNELHNNAYMED